MSTEVPADILDDLAPLVPKALANGPMTYVDLCCLIGHHVEPGPGYRAVTDKEAKKFEDNVARINEGQYRIATAVVDRAVRDGIIIAEKEMRRLPGPAVPATTSIPVMTDRVEEIRRLHSEIIASFRLTLEKAVRVGELLVGIKAGLPHGAWLPWIAENLNFSERAAQDYMRFYERREELESAKVADLGEARKLLTMGTVERDSNAPRQDERKEPKPPKQAPVISPVKAPLPSTLFRVVSESPAAHVKDNGTAVPASVVDGVKLLWEIQTGLEDLATVAKAFQKEEWEDTHQGRTTEDDHYLTRETRKVVKLLANIGNTISSDSNARHNLQDKLMANANSLDPDHPLTLQERGEFGSDLTEETGEEVM